MSADTRDRDDEMPMKPRLRSSLALRSALLSAFAALILVGTAGSARAATGGRAVDSAGARAPKPKGVDRRSLKAFLASPWQTKLFPAMHRLQRETATSPSELDDVYVSGEAQLRFSDVSGRSYLEITITEAGQTRSASVEDLRALGITSVAKLQALLRQRLRPYFKEWGYVLSHDYEELSNTVDLETSRLARHVWDLRSHRDVQLLLEHQSTVAQLKSSTAGEDFTLFDEGGDDKMILRRGPGFHFWDPGPQQLAMFDGDKLREVRFGDLARLHLSTKAEFDAMLARHLVRISGVKGDANHPHVVANARKVLRKQIHEVESFAGFVLGTTRISKDFVAITELMNAQKRSSLVISSNGEMALCIRWRMGAFRFVIASANGGVAMDVERVHDLVELNLPDRAALEAALAKARAELELPVQ